MFGSLIFIIGMRCIGARAYIEQREANGSAMLGRFRGIMVTRAV